MLPVEPVGLQTVASPDSGHHHVAGAKLRCQASAAPVGGAVARPPACPLQNAGPPLSCLRGGGAALVACSQTVETPLEETLFPALDIGDAATAEGCCAANASPAGQGQNNFCPPGAGVGDVARAEPEVEFSAFVKADDMARCFHSTKRQQTVSDFKDTVEERSSHKCLRRMTMAASCKNLGSSEHSILSRRTIAGS